MTDRLEHRLIQTIRILFLAQITDWASVRVDEMVLLHVAIQGLTFFHLVTLRLPGTL